MKIVVAFFLISAISLFVFAAEVSEISLHQSILESYDAGKYTEASQRLTEMQTRFPERYVSLPYRLLHAKSFLFAGETGSAARFYEEVMTDRKLERFAILPLARISATRGKPEQAILLSQQYLQNPKSPEYRQTAAEVLQYCEDQRKPELLLTTAAIVQQNSSTKRLGQLYTARAYRLQKKEQLSRSLLLSLIRKTPPDDVTSEALLDLDQIDGSRLTEEELMERGEIAFKVWNFELASKYLQPVATRTIDSLYSYARILYFSGDHLGSKRAFQSIIKLFPKDRMIRYCIYQYANVCLHDRDYEKAIDLYSQLRTTGDTGMQEIALYRIVQALRAQSKFDEAIRVISPHCVAKDSLRRNRALYLRGRIHFQTGKYGEALSDFDRVLQSKSFVDRKEALLWKGITLERMVRPKDARAVFESLATGYDYYSIHALQKLSDPDGRLRRRSASSVSYSLSHVPGISQEGRVRSRLESADLLPALLYLHLYEEAAQLLPAVSSESWKLLGVDPRSRPQRYLALAHLYLLGKNYSQATYYSEIFLNNLPKSTSLDSLSPEVAAVLFPLPYRNEIAKFSAERNVDPLLVLSIMRQESKFKRFARSQTFARGLMQLIPVTAYRLASSLGIENFTPDQLYTPEMNINLGTKYIRDMKDEFGDAVEVLAAGYNGGESNLRRWLACSSTGEEIDLFSNIDMKETKKYVMIVKTNYELYRRLYGEIR